jgi:hypothetical protein
MRHVRRSGPRGAVHLSDTYYAGVGAAAALLAAIAVATSSTGTLVGSDSWPAQHLLAPIASVQIGGGGDAAGDSSQVGSAVAPSVAPVQIVSASGAGGSGGGHNSGHHKGGRGATVQPVNPAPVAATPAPAAEVPSVTPTGTAGHAKSPTKVNGHTIARDRSPVQVLTPVSSSATATPSHDAIDATVPTGKPGQGHTSQVDSGGGRAHVKSVGSTQSTSSTRGKSKSH